MFGTPTAKPGSPLLNRAALFLFLALSSAAVFSQSGNRILVLSGTNTTCNWNLQRQATLTLTGNSVNTHINVPQNTTIKTAYILRVVSAGTFTLDFAFTGGGTTTNWASQMNNRPRNGVTYYTFEQYGTTVDITADPDVYPTAAGQVLTRITGATVYTNINLASSEAVGTTVLSILNGGSGQATANDALNAFLPSQVGQAGEFLTTDGANTSWAAAGGGSQVWVNDSGTIQPASGQTTNRLSFTSGAADNATNAVLALDTVSLWVNDGAFLVRAANASSNVFGVMADGGGIWSGRFGLDPDAAFSFPNSDSSFTSMRSPAFGDPAANNVIVGVFDSENFNYFSQIELTSNIANPAAPVAFLDIESSGNVDPLGRIRLQATSGSEAITITTSATATTKTSFAPSTASTGSAVAHFLDTSNVLTNGDKTVSFRNAGTEQSYITPLGHYVSSKGSAYLAADATRTDATPVSLGLSATVNNAKKYSFELTLFCENSTAADGVRVDFEGGTATATNFRAHAVITDSTPALAASAQVSALATDITATSITGDTIVIVNGSFEPSASGTFIPRIAEEADGGGTLTVYRGSNLIVTEIP